MKNIIPDISHHKQVYDWKMLKDSCPFIISKATEGVDFVDDTLGDFISNCEKHQIPYWLFAFLTKGNELQQTKFMIETCKNKVGKYFVGYIIDIEKNNNASDVKKAMDYLESLNIKYMVYTGYKDYEKYKSILQTRSKDCAWWESRYGKNDGVYNASFPCHDGVDLHQFTSKGEVLFLSKEIDLNRVVNKPLEWFMNKKEVAPKKDVKTVAQEVVNGQWGNNPNRQAELEKQGYNYKEVQKAVNDLMSAKNTKTTKYYPQYKGSSVSIIVALESIGVKDLSKAHRKLIAQANGIKNYKGTAQENTALVKLVKQGKLIHE